MSHKSKSESKPKHDFTKGVMHEIHTKKIKMRPKSYFYVGSFFLGLGLISSIVVAVFFVNIVTFHIRYYEILGLVGFGPEAFVVLARLFPWIPFGVALLSTTTGMYFLRQYDISYRTSFNALAAGTVVVVIATGVGLDYGGVSHRMQKVEPMKGFYHLNKPAKSQWVTGLITEVNKGKISIIDPRGNEVVIVHAFEDGMFEEGIRIHAIGDWKNEVFVAREIHIKTKAKHMHVK